MLGPELLVRCLVWTKTGYVRRKAERFQVHSGRHLLPRTDRDAKNPPLDAAIRRYDASDSPLGPAPTMTTSTLLRLMRSSQDSVEQTDTRPVGPAKYGVQQTLLQFIERWQRI